MSYGREIKEEFARAYARLGNATQALTLVLGIERVGKMQAHTLRARASELLNNYHTVELIEQHKAEMRKHGEVLPHYRGRTSRTDLIRNKTEKKPLIKTNYYSKRSFKINRKIRNITEKIEKLLKSIS